jgi:hypothetical protein
VLQQERRHDDLGAYRLDGRGSGLPTVDSMSRAVVPSTQLTDARKGGELWGPAMRVPRLGVVVATAATAVMVSVGAAGAHPSCWGQASSTFAMEGRMGAHASSFESPRLGLRNLARTVLGEDATMADLGAFVAAAEGYEIEACAP